MNLDSVKKIYFIGVGGIGMSAVAGIAKEKGFTVSGSDNGIYDPAKSVLDKYGISYFESYSPEHISGSDLVVTTSGVDPANPELIAAQEQNIPIVSFAEVLAEFVKDKKIVMVVGTHGKGTTSGMIAYSLKNIDDSSFFVGGVLTDLNTNFYFGKGEYFVIEGDEYKANFNDNNPKFSFFVPDLLLINNIEYDHPDLYPDINAYKNAFAELAKSLPEQSTIVYNADDKNVLSVIRESKAKKVGFSVLSKEHAKYTGGKASFEEGKFVFDVEVLGDDHKLQLVTKLPGLMYTYNTLAAASALLELDYKIEDFAALISEYSGIKRRYEVINNGVYTIIDDYAHHPTAVKDTLLATREKYPNRRIIAFFEPHTYSRTKETLNELAEAFEGADVVFLAEVYPAREQKLPTSITGHQVVERISQYHSNVSYVKDRADAMEKYSAIAQEGDVIVVMAVGSFNTLAYDLREKYGFQH